MAGQKDAWPGGWDFEAVARASNVWPSALPSCTEERVLAKELTWLGRGS